MDSKKEARTEKRFRQCLPEIPYAALVTCPVNKLIGLSIMLAITGCSGEVYLHDGVTDGDTFYLAKRATSDSDPVLQSWVSYSLGRSVCQLQIGGENPARESSFDCEMTSRRLLLDTWHEKQAENPDLRDAYLDELSSVQNAGFLDEYVVRHFGKRHWELPDDLDVAAFNKWRRTNLPGHKAQMRIIGSWNYAKNVSPY